MKKFKTFYALLCAVLAAVCLALPSEAEVKITIKNNRSHNLSLAFRWAGFDSPDDRRSGWYGVKAGESRTITFKDAVYALTAQDFGYYATGGGKVWAGKSNDERPLAVIIHPKSKFGGHPDDSIDGGKKVYFRHISLKQTDDSRENGNATLTFNP
jgi:hypothetical protein